MPLLILQAHHAVFGGPVVGRAHALAAATLAPARLEANTATASILADLGLDADTVAAALLHDALHASPLTRQELEVSVSPSLAVPSIVAYQDGYRTATGNLAISCIPSAVAFRGLS